MSHSRGRTRVRRPERALDAMDSHVEYGSSGDKSRGREGDAMGTAIYQVDSFTREPFKGNPAGVCLLECPATEVWMQSVAMEMNLSETAFVEPRADGEYNLRWFTPAVEVELCGHATLAAAHVLWESGILSADEQARFHTASGLLLAVRRGDRIELDFPANPPRSVDPRQDLLDALGVSAVFFGKTRWDFFLEVGDAGVVRRAAPDFSRLRTLGVRGAVITAASDADEIDFISRFFAPGAGVDEDPVTGAAHCALAPYWARKLGRSGLTGYQASARGGVVHCRVDGDRVLLSGDAVTVVRGELLVA
jgi:PhzF family phenazine biosynthesis protein